MPVQPDIEIFEKRSINQSIEAAFDFLRQNRKVWFRGTLIYLLPYAMVIALLWLPNARAESIDTTFSMVFEAFGHSRSLAFLLPGFFLSALFTVSLLRRGREEHLSGLTWRQLALLWLPSFVRTLRSAVFLLLAVWVVVLVPFPLQTFLYVVLIPLWFVLPSHTLADNNLLSAVRLSVKHGFRSWFGLLIMLFFMAFVSFMLSFAVQLPVALFFSLSGLVARMSEAFVQEYLDVVRYVILALVSYTVFVGASFVTLGLCYLSGSAGADYEDENLDGEIDRFEYL